MSKSTVHLFYSDHRGVEVKHRLVTPLVAAEVIARATYGGLHEEAVNELAWSLEHETSGYTIGTEHGDTITALPESSPHVAKAYGPAASSPFEVIAAGTYDEATDTWTVTPVQSEAAAALHKSCDDLGYVLPVHPDCPACTADDDCGTPEVDYGPDYIDYDLDPAAAACVAAYDVLEAAEDSYEESVEGWNRAAAMEALDKASEAYAIAKKAWQEQVLALR